MNILHFLCWANPQVVTLSHLVCALKEKKEERNAIRVMRTMC